MDAKKKTTGEKTRAETADMLFEYLRDLLYHPTKAKLDIEALDDEFKQVGEGLEYIGHCLDEQRVFATALARGTLTMQPPSPDNPFAAPLKSLHASLKHLTWTSQQVAKGDYNQRVDFMGEFADAFNTMTQQLKSRQVQLETENANNRHKTLALEQSYRLLEQVTTELKQWIVVMGCETGDVLFQNRAAHEAFEIDRTVVLDLQDYLAVEKNSITTSQQHEAEVQSEEGDMFYFSVVSYPMKWKNHTAVAHVVSDISDERRQMQQLENVAYQDTLTGISNRYHGMQMLRDWLDEKRAFSLCFVDLDNLKFVNDNFGHSEGDRYIIDAAHTLKKLGKGGGVVSRVGGDEFMLLVPGVAADLLETTMEKLRDEVIATGKRQHRPYMPSISYGVVEAKQNSNMSSGELLSLADERMYAYKRKHKTGRGQTY